MGLADKVLAVNNDLPIRTEQPVHSGKVRSVYWLTDGDSRRLIQQHCFDVAEDSAFGWVQQRCPTIHFHRLIRLSSPQYSSAYCRLLSEH